MHTPHKVNNIYAILLIILGLFGFLARYYEIGDYQVTSLIPAFFGIILLPMSKGIKNENTVIAHLAVVLTLILGVMITFMFFKGYSAEFIGSRKFFIFLISGLASYIALGIYVAGFIDKKKNG
jgi:hypothetical protein